MWGLSNMNEIYLNGIIAMGLVYPLSEHVDIFPVRLCLHSHWVFSVYLISILHSRLYPFGRNKRQGLDPFLIKYKDSLHIHKWHGTFYYRDTTAYIMTIPSSPFGNVVRCYGDIKAWLSSHICVLTAPLSFAWTALRAVRILPVLSISTGGAVQISFH